MATNQLIVERTNIRDFALPPHFKVDEPPYGGGPGMVLKPEPLVEAINHSRSRRPDTSVIFLSPKGTPFTQSLAEELSFCPSLTLVCSRYEGFDQRAVDLTGAREISIGPYILMGGEVGAMVLIEAIIRLCPGILGNKESVTTESFSDCLLKTEAPHYTRPPLYQGLSVPEVLLSGDHARIKKWREEEY